MKEIFTAPAKVPTENRPSQTTNNLGGHRHIILGALVVVLTSPAVTVAVAVGVAVAVDQVIPTHSGGFLHFLHLPTLLAVLLVLSALVALRDQRSPIGGDKESMGQDPAKSAAETDDLGVVDISVLTCYQVRVSSHRPRHGRPVSQMTDS